MTTIHKFKVIPQVSTEMPSGAKVLTAGAQGDCIYVWAQVDTDDLCSDRFAIEVYGTGHEIYMPENLTFINTVFMGPLVFHVFERYQRRVA